MQSLDNQIQEFTGELMSTSNPTAHSIIFDERAFQNVQRIAEVMANSNVTVPKHLQKNVGDCMAITMQALVWGMNPWPVAQKTHLVNGVLGYEAQLVNAVVQASGAIKGRPYYEYQGEGNALECRVGAVISGEQEITWGEWLKSSDVTTKNSPLWKTNPKQQMGYLQFKNWARLYCPGAILGIYTADELETSTVQERDITPAPTSEKPATRTAGLKNKIAAKTKSEVIEHEPEAEPETYKSIDDLWLEISRDIDNADSAASLKQAITYVDQLPEDLKQKARFAYKFRECELKGLPVIIEQQDGVAHIINTETGDIIY